MTGQLNRSASRRGFTIPELLVVIGVIALLIAVLVPALAGALRTGDMAKSQNSLKQNHMFMGLYSTDNHEFIPPSQFDYRVSVAPPQNYPVKVRSHPGLTATPWGNLRYQGTWADILWTTSGLGEKAEFSGNIDAEVYRYDSPDRAVYEEDPDFSQSPFRSAAPNSQDTPPGLYPLPVGPRPYGSGAHEVTLPGFFAANDFFNARPDAPDRPNPNGNGAMMATPDIGWWYTTGQIKSPDRSMYLVDSFAGETISFDVPGSMLNPYNNEEPAGGGYKTIEVDFRYNG